MELPASTITLESSGKIVAQDFSIANQALVIQYMTSAIYSNPLLSMCREIMSNSRDAHIEVGKKDVPIKVKLPNKLYSTVEFKDEGPGLHPSRIIDVFTKYGESTKRNNNNESGGWGIGCKSPWAYTDTFNVITTSLENDKLIRRQYAAIKGDSQTKPKIIEMGNPIHVDESFPVNEQCTGTIISVEVPEKDWQKIQDHCTNVALFWTVKPVFEGNDSVRFKSFTTHYEGVNYKIIDIDGYNNPSYVTIDGIPYPLNWDNIPTNNDKVETLRNFSRGGYSKKLVLHFNVGQLEVNLNREELSYSNKTVNAIIDRLTNIYTDLQTQVSDAITNAKDLWEASIEFNKANNIFSDKIVTSAMWNGINITGQNLHIPHDSNIHVAHIGWKGRKKTVCYNNVNNRIEFNDDSALFINDETELSIVKAKYYLEQNPNISHIQVIIIGNTVLTDADQKLLDNWKVKSGFNTLTPVAMSTLPKKPKVTYSRAASSYTKSPTVKAYLLNSDDKFESADIKLSEGEGVYVVVDRLKTKDYVYTNESQYQPDANKNIIDIRNITGTPIYGIPERFVDDLGDKWIPIKDYMTDTITKLYGKLSNPKYDNALAFTKYSPTMYIQKLLNYRTIESFNKVKSSIEIDSIFYNLVNGYNTYTFNGTLEKEAFKLLALLQYEPMFDIPMIPEIKNIEKDIDNAVSKCKMINYLCDNAGWRFEQEGFKLIKDELIDYLNSKKKSLTSVKAVG